jgi:formyl-CoA transferase
METGLSAALLERVLVLDLTQYLAGPVASHVLEQLGADVVKLEPPGGDPARRGKGLARDSEPYPVFLALHRGKQSIAVDLRQPSGHRIALDLARKADVVLENYRPGVARKLGVSYADLTRVNPRLIYCSISGFGQDGPLAEAAATDGPMQAFAGIMHLQGADPNGTPFPPSQVNMADVSAGLFAAQAVTAALFARTRTGTGCYVDVSLFESVLQLIPRQVHEYLEYGEGSSSGSGGELRVATPTLRTSDGGYVLVQLPYAHHRERFRELVARLGSSPELLTDERFSTQASRMKHADAYLALLGRAFALHSRDEWLAALREAQIPCAPVHTLGEALNHPQLEHRAALSEVEVPVLGSVRALGPPFRFSPEPLVETNQPPSVVGADGEDVLRRILGYSEEAIAGLISEEVVRLPPA